MKINEIGLGTVQFGMDYGISNARGKIPTEEVFEILRKAREYGIEILDTASEYGSSEQVIGEFIHQTNAEFKIVSKFARANFGSIDESLKKLNVKSLYACLVHHFDDFAEDPALWDNLCADKKNGKIAKIGFSLYYPSELNRLFADGVKFDIVQVPYNVFDRRFEGYFRKLKDLGIEIHVRSVFLQGLFFKKPEDLDGEFSKISGKIRSLSELALNNKSSIASICLRSIMNNENIDKVIIGVDSLAHLDEIVEHAQLPALSSDDLKSLAALREDNENIILPTNWRKQ
jgi:aryl-alcohol dehydrogenase-like predicted oxidoreductase